MNHIIVKPFDTEQPVRLATLFEAQLREHGISSSLDALMSVLRTVAAHPEHGFVLSATCDGVPVGVAYAACILSLEYGGWSGWLEEFYVLPVWRGRGVGSKLLAAVVAAATGRGWAALDLEVDAKHERVFALYRRNRFEPVSRTRFVRLLSRE